MDLVKHFENLYIPKNFHQNHYYYADLEGKKPYTGITTVLGVIAKPALIQWAANKAVEYVKENSETHDASPEKELGSEIWFHQKEDILEKARYAHKNIKEKAGDRGTEIHNRCEEWVRRCIDKHKGRPTALLEREEPEEVEQFVEWAKENDVFFHESEKPLYDPEMWLAGTVDLVLGIGGKKYLTDIKTSKGVYEDAFLQCAAYRYMSEKMGLKDFHGSMVIHLPKGGELKTYERYDYQADLEAFVAAHTIYKYKNNI